jgi:hypothetical protein
MTSVMNVDINLRKLADTPRECSLRERIRRHVTAFVQA